MRNSTILLCFLLLAWANLILSEHVNNNQNELGRLEELLLQNSKYKEQLNVYKNSDCQRFKNSTDIYIVRVPGIEPFAAPCQSDLFDGGWTVIQRRVDGNVNFERSWNEYRDGFGDLKGDYFIGLEKLHQMTSAQAQELLIYFERDNYKTDYEMYTNFLIGSEEDGYVLNVQNSDNGFKNNIGQKFTTFDRDNDEYWWGNCAKEFHGGWWFGSCVPFSYTTNLNGPYLKGPLRSSWGICFNGNNNIKSVLMLMRPQIDQPIN